MTWQLNSFAVIFLLATTLTGIVFAYTVRHKEVRGAIAFTFLVLSVTSWALFQSLEYAVNEPVFKILFAKFQYFGISTIGVTWYLFSYSYSRGKTWPGKSYFFLFILPLLTIIAAFTNEMHGWLWPQITPISNQPNANLLYGHGPVFWTIFVYNYILLAIGTISIIRTAVSSKEIYRQQMVGLIGSAIVPWLGNLIYVLGLSPIPGLDLTPLGFALSAVVTAWSIFFLKLFDLIPVAYDQVVANLVDGVIVLDIHNRIADFNPKAREFLGIDNERAVGRDIASYLQRWPDLIERFRDVQKGQAEVQIGEGRISDIDVRISPLLDSRQNPLGRIIIVRDISEQKKLERMREDFTQAIVHDLRNPLTTVALGLEMLRRQATVALPKTQLESLDITQASVQQMLELVGSILDIYRLESGEMPLDRKPTSLQTIAADALKPIATIANRKRILLQSDIPAGMQDIFVDHNLMRRVLQNLLDNSVKYSKEGRVIRVHAGFDKDDGTVVVSVIDTGDGIEPAVRKNLFDKYISGGNKTNGSGLGLTFCRLAVEAHGGRIWVDENYQTGTKISFTIPDNSKK